MPYAAADKIAEDWFEGSVEIRNDQYAEALEGMCAGLVVTIEGGFKVAPPIVPEPLPIPAPTPEELAMTAFAQRDQMLAVAAIRIAPLQDAVDLGRATPDAIARLQQWKGYRVDLNEIDLQENFPLVVSWPVAPGDAIPNS